MPSPGHIPAFIAITLTDWAQEHGLAADDLCRILQVDHLDTLRQESCRLTPEDYDRLLAFLYERTGRASLGVDIGARLTVASYGVLGHAMLSAATVGESIRTGMEYYRLTSAFMTLNDAMTPEALVVTARLDYPLPALQRFAPEEQIVGATAVARELLGPDFSMLSVDFAMPEPPYAETVRQWMGCPVHYNQPEHRFRIDARLLGMSLRTANALTARHLLSLCQQLLEQAERAGQPGELLQKLHATLQSRVGYWPGMLEVASQLGMSERTLRRRLQEQGTDYQTEIDKARQFMALQLIKNRDITVEHLAAILGYSEAVSFRRAFQRWTGQSPKAYRQQAQAPKSLLS